MAYKYIPPAKDDIESIKSEETFGECWNCKNHVPWVACYTTGIPLTYPIHDCCGYIPNLPDCVLEKLKGE